MILDDHPGSGSFFYPGSRIQGVKKAPDPGSRIRNTAPQAV